MRSSLPPLSSLRAFVSVARHLSFSKAAKELHVTPAAITHQIHALERDLGAPLFYRNRKYVTLTRMAEACLPELSQAFDLMRSAVASESCNRSIRSECERRPGVRFKGFAA